MSTKRLTPKWEDINRHHIPIRSFQRDLILYLEKNLPGDWEIYYRPWLNNENAPLAFLHPGGVLIICDFEERHPLTTEEEAIYKRRCRRFVASLNVRRPEIKEAVEGKKPKVYSALAYPKKRADDIEYVIEKDLCLFSGQIEKWPEIFKKLEPRDKNLTVLYEEWASKVRFELDPPFHKREMGLPIRLTQEQKRHSTPTPNVHQRLRGVAGGGKSLVIAQRAAALAEQGLRVLIVYYNITLQTYLEHHLKRTQRDFWWGNIECIHFHLLCKNYLIENGYIWPWGLLDTNFWNEKLPDTVQEYLKAGKNSYCRKYDAILIDEGQDFSRQYYNILCDFLSDRNELLLTRDERQNIYGIENSWTDTDPKAEIKTRFRGQWRTLSESYRMPSLLIPLAQKFAETFLPGYPQDILGVQDPQYELNLSSPHLVWRNCQTRDEMLETAVNGVSWLMKSKNIKPQDIGILVALSKDGLDTTENLENSGIRVHDMFHKNSWQQREKKIEFRVSNENLKVSTINSFKGWELTTIILLIPNDSDFKRQNSIRENLDNLVYTAMTRTRANLIVYNCNRRYDDYSSMWSKSWNN